MERIELTESEKKKINEIITAIETSMDDDTESIITNERYDRIMHLLADTYTKKERPKLSVSDKIDKVLTNRILALPIFFLIMWGNLFYRDTDGWRLDDRLG